MKKLFTFFLTLVAGVGTIFAWDYMSVPIGDLYYNLDATTQTAEVFGGSTTGPIRVDDNSIDDWNTLPAQYVVQAICPADAAMTGLKSVKVYADAKYINILVEPNMDDLPDFEWVPFHVFIDADNSDATGGYGDLFTDANADIVCETALIANGEPYNYNPAVFKWWGEVGGNGWQWTDPAVYHDDSDFWGAIIGEDQLPVGKSQFVDGKFEIQLSCELLGTVHELNNDEFGIGFDIEPNWSTEGVLPCASPTENNPAGRAPKLKVKTFRESGSVKTSDDVVIPATVDYEGKTYAVTSIKNEAFSGHSGLTSVTIPDNVTSIGNQAFLGCTSLTSVVIPNSVTSIGESAFRDCSSLISVTVGKNVTNIGYSVFQNCNDITSVVWNAKNCNGYKFGAQVESFVFGDEVEIIPAYICSGMNKLPTMTIPNSVTSIGNSAFADCSGLTSVTIPNSVTSIGYGAFSRCSGLTSVAIGNRVTSIGDQAFSGCSDLTNITIPASVTSIGDVPFLECGNLKTIDIDADNPNYSSVEGVLFNKNKTTLIQCPGGKQGTYTIPNSVTSIGTTAFGICTGLTSVTIPNSVTSIGDQAFVYCSSLTSVTIPNKIDTISSGAFYGCESLKKVIIGENVKSVGWNAFAGCKRITDIVCYAKEIPGVQEDAFLDVSRKAYLWVPMETKRDYEVDAFWGEFDVKALSANTVSADNLVIVPSENTAEVIWPSVSGATAYELVIKDKFGNVVCTLIFNAQGQLTSIAFAAPSRDGAPQRTQTAGFSFTITGLDSGSSYDLTMTSKDQNGNTIDEKQLSFSTNGSSPEAIDTIDAAKLGSSSKILRNGQVLIRRGDKLYTMQGQEVE